MKVSIIHPFTPRSAGVVEQSVAVYHSQPHVSALYSLIDNGHQCSIEYLSAKFFKYSFEKENLKWKFFPVDYKFNGDHKKWKKQHSSSCLKYYKRNIPDIAFINMSGHSSPFSHDLAKLLISKEKKYIPMLGGQHYSDTPENRAYYKNADHILVHTHLQKQEMEEMELFKGKRIEVYPLGVDCDFFKPSNKSIDTVQPELIYVGRITEWKRVHLAIEAVLALKKEGFEKAHLNIIGPVSSQKYYQILQEMVNKNGLTRNITFVGYKDHVELPKYLSNADLFLLPSDKETFGMVMIESMSCGTPVAGMNCKGGPADVISDGVNGILSDVENYSSRIVGFYKDKNLKNTLSNNARNLILKKYSLDITNKVIESSVNSIINGNATK
jgi:glycosyltransferase involved in cell wall biosynthesis